VTTPLVLYPNQLFCIVGFRSLLDECVINSDIRIYVCYIYLFKYIGKILSIRHGSTINIYAILEFFSFALFFFPV
jgi:hypothetical protein